MQKEQFNKLMEAASENATMSIAINRDGAPVQGGFVPWERTVSAFNMQTPKVTMAVSDLQDETIMAALRKCDVVGCYIFAGLSDYGFISGFKKIRDLFIMHGEQIQDLSFVRPLSDLFMFYLEDASLPDLKPLIDLCNAGQILPAKCFGFYHCKVKDTSSLSDIDFSLSELLVWPVDGDTRERWQTAKKPGIFKFYEEKK